MLFGVLHMRGANLKKICGREIINTTLNAMNLSGPKLS